MERGEELVANQPLLQMGQLLENNQQASSRGPTVGMPGRKTPIAADSDKRRFPQRQRSSERGGWRGAARSRRFPCRFLARFLDLAIRFSPTHSPYLGSDQPSQPKSSSPSPCPGLHSSLGVLGMSMDSPEQKRCDKPSKQLSERLCLGPRQPGSWTAFAFGFELHLSPFSAIC